MTCMPTQRDVICGGLVPMTRTGRAGRKCLIPACVRCAVRLNVTAKTGNPNSNKTFGVYCAMWRAKNSFKNGRHAMMRSSYTASLPRNWLILATVHWQHVFTRIAAGQKTQCHGSIVSAKNSGNSLKLGDLSNDNESGQEI